MAELGDTQLDKRNRDRKRPAPRRKQAQEVASYFLTLPAEERPTAIFSSPFYRCIQTAKPIAQALQLPIFLEHGISEWYSPVKAGTGLHPRPAAASQLKKLFSEIDDSWSTVWYPSMRGEDVAEVYDRTAGFLEAFIPEVESRLPPSHSRILLVSHAATVITLYRELMGDRSLPIRVGCCTLTHMERKVGDKKIVGHWNAKTVASGSHLKGGIERDWGFEDIEVAKGRVVEDPGEPGTEGDEPGPEGCQLQRSNL